jgi:NAD-dependent deacetylase
MEKAIEAVKGAELFMVVGTSLVVYPAAGLVNYAPWPIPKFIIDKKLPQTAPLYNTTLIEKPATEGMREAQKLLSAWK